MALISVALASRGNFDRIAAFLRPPDKDYSQIKAGKWQVLGQDGSKLTAIGLNAESAIASNHRQAIPKLMIRCVDGKPALGLSTGLQIAEEPLSGGSPLKMSFDNGGDHDVIGVRSSGGRAMWMPNAKDELDMLKTASALKISFAPLNGEPVSTTFDVRNFQELEGVLESTCSAGR